MKQRFIKEWMRNAEGNPEAQEGIKLLVAAMSTPKAKLQQKVLKAWDDTLTSDEKNWLRYTPEGRKEMWRRICLANELCARVVLHG